MVGALGERVDLRGDLREALVVRAQLRGVRGVARVLAREQAREALVHAVVRDVLRHGRALALERAAVRRVRAPLPPAHRAVPVHVLQPHRAAPRAPQRAPHKLVRAHLLVRVHVPIPHHCLASLCFIHLHLHFFFFFLSFLLVLLRRCGSSCGGSSLDERVVGVGKGAAHGERGDLLVHGDVVDGARGWAQRLAAHGARRTGRQRGQTLAAERVAARRNRRAAEAEHAAVHRAPQRARWRRHKERSVPQRPLGRCLCLFSFFWHHSVTVTENKEQRWMLLLLLLRKEKGTHKESTQREQSIL